MSEESNVDTGRLFQAADYILDYSALHSKRPPGEYRVLTASGSTPFTDKELVAAAHLLRRLGFRIAPRFMNRRP